MSRRGVRKSKVPAAEANSSRRRTSVARRSGRGLSQAGNGAVTHVIAQLQNAYGEDFSGVQIHTGREAKESAAALGAVAFTRGEHVFLGAEAPAPESTAGRKLLAHELAHVVQQRQAASVDPSAIGPAGDSFERSADHAAEKAVSGRAAQVSAGGSVPGVQLQRADGVNREQAEEKIKEFLKTAPRTPTGSIDLPRIKYTFIKLASAPGPGEKNSRNAAAARMRELFDSKFLPANPRDLAPRIAAALDYPMHPAALKALKPDSKHDPSLKEKAEDWLESGKKNTTDPLAGVRKPKEAGRNDPGARADEGLGGMQTPPLPASKPFEGEQKPRPHADPEDSPKKKEKKEEAKKEESKLPVSTWSTTPEAPPAAAPAAAPAKTGLGVLPSVVDSSIREAQRSGRPDADLILGKSLLPQQQVVFGQVRHLLQMSAMGGGARVTAVNVFIGGKLVKTVRLGGN
jgi:hypothetical protein